MNNGKTFSGYKWFSVLNEREVPEKITGTEAQQDVYTMVLAAMKKDPGVAQQILDHYTKDPEYKTLLLTGIYGLPDISLKALNRPPETKLSGINKKYLTPSADEFWKDADGKPAGKRPGMVISADDFKTMFKDLWLKYVKQGTTSISEHIITQHAYNTLISVIGFTILQHDQISQIPGETFTMEIAGKKVALSTTGAGRSGQSWKNVKNLYDQARAQTNPAMFDNVLGNIKAIMQKHTPDIFDTQEDLDSEFETQATASVEYVMKSLGALKFGKDSTPGLSDEGAMYLYHVLTYPLVEADQTIDINHSEKAAIDKIVSDANVAKSDPTLKSMIREKLLGRYPSIKDMVDQDHVGDLLNNTSPDALWRTDPKKESTSRIFSKVDQTQKHKTWRQVNETDTSRYMD